MHNPDVYPRSDEFKPDRFLTLDGRLNEKVRNPELAIFGFGRRFVSFSTLTVYV